MTERRMVGLASANISHRTFSIVVNGLYAAPRDRTLFGGAELVRSRRLDFPRVAVSKSFRTTEPGMG